jgi:hypothetical protein
MGALGKDVKLLTVKKLGRESWKRKVELTNKMWTDIENAIDRLDLSCEKLRLYQDGLPVCGREVEIVKDIAKAGSPNHQLLLRLQEKGATIMGTESSDLLVEEYELTKQIMSAREGFKAGETDPRLQSLADSLLRRRDQYIGNLINGTLLFGETGIIFLGLLHSLENRLDKNIRIVYPLNRPLGHRGGLNGKAETPNSRR